jgi:hypothetical protein
MTVWTHIGNVQKFPVTPTPTIQKHKGTMGPVKAVDFVNTSLIEMAFDLQCDEWTLDNLLMGLLGQLATDTAGEYIKIGVTVVRRQIKFVGNNAIGPKWEVICRVATSTPRRRSTSSTPATRPRRCRCPATSCLTTHCRPSERSGLLGVPQAARRSFRRAC